MTARHGRPARRRTLPLVLAIVALAATLAGTTTPPAAQAKSGRQAVELRRHVAKLKRQIRQLRRKQAALRAGRIALRKDRDAARAELVTARANRDVLQADRDRLAALVEQPDGSPPAPSNDPVIAAAGDIACDPLSSSYNTGLGTGIACRQKHTSDLLVDANLARVLTLGDIQYENALLSNFLTSFDPTWGRVKELIRPAIGNHEYHLPGASGYFDYFNGVGNVTGPAGDRGKGYYSYDVGSAWHLIALNSNCSEIGGCGAGSPQEQWLRADLAANPTKCTLAYWHHPHFSSGHHGNDNGGANPTGAFWQALYDGGAELVLNGHDHDYERFAAQTPDGTADPVRGIREFVIGTGGKSHHPFTTVTQNSEARDSDAYGVLELTLHASSYDWRFVPEVESGFGDSGSGTCH